jgi:hypothetical protein
VSSTRGKPFWRRHAADETESRRVSESPRGTPSRIKYGAALLVILRTIVGMFAAFSLLALASCAGPRLRAERFARENGLQPIELRGSPFVLRAFAKGRGPGDLLVIFLDGDGSPWVRQGRRIAADPTPRSPLALKLAARTPGAVLYLARPCYFLARPQRACAARYWTSERYSAAVVKSMTEAAESYLEEHHFSRALLVGYSGGGTLAVLMARSLPCAIGVITIAGNLDPDAWTQLHGYLPLTGSLNPSLEPPLPAALRDWYLIGERDRNVPFGAAQRYLKRVAPSRIWKYANFDHVCCWVRAWPSIFARASGELPAHAPDPAAAR